MANKFTKITIVTRREKMEVLEPALVDLDVGGMTVTQVYGNGIQNGQMQYVNADGELTVTLIPKICIEIITETARVQKIIDTVLPILRTGVVGDGKIFLKNLEGSIYTVSSRMKTEEEGPSTAGEDKEDFVMSTSDKPLTKVTIVTRKEKMNDLRKAMVDIGVTGMTLTDVDGCGRQYGVTKLVEGITHHFALLPKVKVEIVVCSVPVQKVIDTALDVLNTGSQGDGKIFVSPISHAIRVRTGEKDSEAI